MNNSRMVMFSGTGGSKAILKNNLLLLALAALLFFLNCYNKTLFYRPVSIHQWRQADCLSITKNYYEEGMHFFNPKIHWQGVKNGETVSECPILNYTVAGLWKIFGEHEFIYRLLEYFIFLAGMFVLFNTILRFLRSPLLAFFITGIFLTSPLLVYYSFNFIADVPALSFCITSFCLFFNFYHTRVLKYFYLALLFGTLAVLIKASALVGLGLLLFFSALDIFNLTTFFKTEKLFEKKTLPLIAVLLSVGLIYGWYQYALHYNNNNSNGVFLLTVLPIWDMDREKILSTLELLCNNLLPVFLNKAMLFMLFCLVLYVIANFKNLSVFLKYAFAFSGLFFIAYILFFFQVFTVHDYYLGNLMIFPVIILFSFAHLISQTGFIAQNRRFARLAVFLFIFFNAFYAAAFYRLRMIENDNMVEWFPFITKAERELAAYYAWEYNNGLRALENITPALRQLGIKRNDLTLCVPDASANVSLYFTDQKGFMLDRGLVQADSAIFTNRYAGRGIKYLVLSDRSLKNERSFQKIMPKLELILEQPAEVYKFKSPL